MKILKLVPTREVKRCFVTAKLFADRKHFGHMKILKSEGDYIVRLNEAKKKVLKMDNKTLDKLLAGNWKKRLISYNQADWYSAEASPSELGVWNRAGEMPLRWTNHSLVETAKTVKWALNRKNGFKNKKIRAAHAIKGILKVGINVIQKEDHLLPIVFKCDTGTQGRYRLKHKTKGDIEDGCMRSIALTVSGAQKLRIYFGIPKKNP